MYRFNIVNFISIIILMLILSGCSMFSVNDEMTDKSEQQFKSDKTVSAEALNDSDTNHESAENAFPCEKEEIIYADLLADGNIDTINVFNTIYTENGKFADYGNYADIMELSGAEHLDYSKGVISGESKEDTVTYIGSMPDAVLPWTVKIEYFLDGQKIAASNLAGRDGKLRIAIAIDKSEGYIEDFYDDFLLSVTMLLDNDVFSNVSAENISVSNISDKQIITGYFLPGSEKYIELDADVEDFHIPEIELRAMKPDEYDVQIDDSGIRREIDRIEDLKTEISEESDAGIADLNLGDISSRINEFSNNTDDLCAKADEFSDEFAKIKDNTGKVVDGTQEIENNAALLYNAAIRFEDSAAEIANSIFKVEETYGRFLPPDIKAQLEALSEGSKKLLDNASELTDSSMQLLDGGIELHEGTAELNDSVAEVDVKDFSDKVHDAKDKILEIKDETDRITQDVDDMKTRVNDKMNQYDEKISDAKSKIDTISDSIDREIDQIKANDDPDGDMSFASSKNGRIGSVVFIMKTHAIGE